MEEISQKILLGARNGNLLEVVNQVYFEIKEVPIESFGLILAQLHNEHQIDLVEELLRFRSGVQDINSFPLTYVFSTALPLIEYSVIQVMKCLNHLASEAKGDMTTSVLIGPFMEFCKKEPSRIREVLSISIKSIDEYFDFISPALIAGAEYEFQHYFQTAVALIDKADTRKDLVNRAIFSLGKIRYESAEQSTKAFDTIAEKVHEYDSTAFSVCIRALFDIYLQNPSLDKPFLTFISNNLAKFDDLAIQNVSEALSFNCFSIADAIEDQLLNIISKVNPENIAAINVMDWVLTKLLENDKAEKAVDLYEELCKQSDGNIPLARFDSFSTKLLANPSLLSRTITKWLISRNVLLCRQASELFHNAYSKKNIEIECDKSQIVNVITMPHLFLARKAIGWFYMRPITAISFVNSMIDSCSKEELVEVENVCFEPLLISYPGSAGDYLKTQAKHGNKFVKSFCKRLLARLKKYHEGLDSIRSINELKPSEQDRQTYNRREQRLINESMKSAKNKSVFLDTIQETVLLYGNKSISYIYLSPDNKVRQEIPLHQFSTSVEFPSLQTLDPHNLDLVLRTFQIEGCKS